MFERIHGVTAGTAVVPQFEFLSFSSCASAIASCSLSARRRSEFGETFSVIAMLCLSPVILPLSMLSLNPIRGIFSCLQSPVKILFQLRLYRWDWQFFLYISPGVQSHQNRFWRDNYG